MGLLVLVAAVWLYDPARISYPGAYTLLPCAATAALVAAGTGSGSAPNRWLAWPPLVLVGLLSYSLYLWHLPLLTFAAYYSITPLTALERVATIAGIFALAAVSWRFIEQPVRQRVVFKSRRALLLGASVVSALVLAIGSLLWHSDGFPQRLPAAERALLFTPDVTAIAALHDPVAGADPRRSGLPVWPADSRRGRAPCCGATATRCPCCRLSGN